MRIKLKIIPGIYNPVVAKIYLKTEIFLFIYWDDFLCMGVVQLRKNEVGVRGIRQRYRMCLSALGMLSVENNRRNTWGYIIYLHYT